MANSDVLINNMTVETNTKENPLTEHNPATTVDGGAPPTASNGESGDDFNSKTSIPQPATPTSTADTINGPSLSFMTILQDEAVSISYPSCISNSLVQFKPLVPFEELSFEEKIGHGSFGVVYKVKWQERLVAAKEFMANPEQAEAIETEVRQLSRVAHPNIIELYAITANQHSIYLLMEFVEGGSLHTFLHGKVKPYYSTAHAMSWARQCAEGVAYLHAMKPKPLIHRDLKPLNLLLTNKGRQLKICDFGTVADQATKMTNNRGTAVYMAPEVFSSCKYDEKCDVFSWATILWVVLMRQQPFAEITNAYSIQWQIHKGHRPPMNSKIPQPIQNLMQACWLKEPADRPPMSQVLAFMNKLTADFPGADEPLEYEFKHLQIVCADSARSTESYQLDFSNLKPTEITESSMDLTPTNSTNHTCNSDCSLTPTNSSERHGDLAVATNTATAIQMPTARITGLTCWDAIPEESETTNAHDDAFNLTQSAAASKRYETIRTGMQQNVSFHANPLAIDVDPGAWDLCYAKSDGKEGLTVTETKPMLKNSSMDHRNFRLPMQKMHDDTEDNDNDETDDPSLAEMLDPELQPEQPIVGNEESEAIYREHRRLAKEYLRVDTELYYAQDFKEKILLQLDPEERQKKQEILRKINEKQELLELYNNLKQQRENLLAEQARALRPTGNAQQQQQTQPQETVADDGWVVIQSNTPNT